MYVEDAGGVGGGGGFVFQAEDGIRDLVRSRGLGDVYKRQAEMIKYASNSLLATLISFSNELANLGSALGGIDTVEVMRGVHLSMYFRLSLIPI